MDQELKALQEAFESKLKLAVSKEEIVTLKNEISEQIKAIVVGVSDEQLKAAQVDFDTKLKAQWEAVEAKLKAKEEAEAIENARIEAERIELARVEAEKLAAEQSAIETPNDAHVTSRAILEPFSEKHLVSDFWNPRGGSLQKSKETNIITKITSDLPNYYRVIGKLVIRISAEKDQTKKNILIAACSRIAREEATQEDIETYF